MAKGDVVNGILNATGNFQPAAGVEVVILFVSATGAGDYWSIWEGVNPVNIRMPSLSAPDNVYVAINNTNYLRYTLGASNGGYSGYQTK